MKKTNVIDAVHTVVQFMSMSEFYTMLRELKAVGLYPTRFELIEAFCDRAMLHLLNCDYSFNNPQDTHEIMGQIRHLSAMAYDTYELNESLKSETIGLF